MKKILISAVIVGLGVVFIMNSLTFAQQEKEVLLKKQAQAEIKTDSSDYIIGPEDVLYIHVWREETLTRTVPVRIDGNISLPLVDEVRAAGLTSLQLKEILAERLKEFVDSPNVFVTVMEANSYKVYVSGQVRSPGVFKLRSETSLIQIIVMAGGLTDWADQKRILIMRRESGKEKRITVNYKKIIQGKEPGGDILLKPGDTIIVP
jgi:polysaccharide export outer membrane protein